MRLFLVLVLLQTLMLPTRSAFSNDFQAYSWKRGNSDAFYRGTVTLPDGTRHTFQTTEHRLWFPPGSKVNVKAYHSPTRVAGSRSVNEEKTLSAEAPAAPSEPIPVETAPRQHTDRDDEADAIDYGSPDAIVGQNESSSQDQAGGSDGPSGGDLCESIQATMRFYLGQETIQAKGGLSDFDGESAVVGTLVDWACTLSKAWSWRIQLGRHDLRLKQRETTPSGASERTRSYDRTAGMMAWMKRVDGTPAKYGLGLSYARLPLLKITQPTLNASQLKQQGFGSLSLLARYAPSSGFQAGVMLSPYALGANSFLAYSLDGGWRMPLSGHWFWDLGVRYEVIEVTVPSACKDNPACRSSATSDLALPQGWIGLGRDF